MSMLCIFQDFVGIMRGVLDDISEMNLSVLKLNCWGIITCYFLVLVLT